MGGGSGLRRLEILVSDWWRFWFKMGRGSDFRWSEVLV